MTVDDRLDAAAADFAAPAGTVTGAAAFVRHRQRRRLASMGGLAAMLVVVVGLVALSLANDDGTSNVAAQSREQLARDLETRLMVADDIGPGWQARTPEATPAPSDTCGIAQVDARSTPLASARREFAGAPLSMIGERLTRYSSRDQAEAVVAALRRAFEGCTSFETRNPDGGTTDATLHPLALAIRGTSSYALSGDLTVTDANGDRTTATAFWVALAHRNVVSVIFGVNFSDGPTSNATITHIATRAAARLSGD